MTATLRFRTSSESKTSFSASMSRSKVWSSRTFTIWMGWGLETSGSSPSTISTEFEKQNKLHIPDIYNTIRSAHLLKVVPSHPHYLHQLYPCVAVLQKNSYQQNQEFTLKKSLLECRPFTFFLNRARLWPFNFLRPVLLCHVRVGRSLLQKGAHQPTIRSRKKEKVLVSSSLT